MNYVVLTGKIDLLPQVFATAMLPVGVLAELQNPKTALQVASRARVSPPWVRVISPEGPKEDTGLGHGNAEAIAIATQVAADTVLIDERKATMVARDRGLTVTGTLGVLALAAESKLEDLEVGIHRFIDTKVWVLRSLMDVLLHGN